MARLSTGQAYGNVDRQTSQRLVGAAPMEATPGALAQQQIGAPALQPQASPVNTFQQAGAPTLGGPVRMFAPPDLPQPNQDLANLARSLGGFSEALQQVGTVYQQSQKVREKQAELVGQQLARDLSVSFPGQEFAQVRDNLYRQAQAGDATAKALYDRVQSASPLQLAAADRFVQRSNLRIDLANAAEKYKQTAQVTGVSGASVPKEWLQPGDPRLQSLKTSLIRAPKDATVYAEFEAQIYNKFSELDAAQARDNSAWKEREFGAAANSLLSSLVQAGASVPDAQQTISGMLTTARIALGTEGYQKLIDSLDASFQAAINIASLDKQGGINYEKQQYLSGQKQVILAGVVAGPNGETYLERLGAKGGAVAQLDGLQRSLSSLKEIKTATDAVIGYQGEKVGTQVISQYNLNDPALVGRDRELAAAQARSFVAQMPEGPAKVEASQQVERAINAGERINEFVRNEAERKAYDIDRSGLTPEQKLEAYDRLSKEGQIDPGQLRGFVADAERERAQRDRPAQNAIEEGIKQLLKKEEGFLKLPGQGQGLQQSESNYLIGRNQEIRDGLNAIRRSGYANNASPQEIFKQQKQYLDMLSKELQGRIDTRAPLSAKPVIQDVNAYYDQRGGFLGLGRGGRAPQATQLNRAVDAGLVMPEPAFRQALTEWAERNKLSDQTRQIIKDSGYGTKADDFFRKQWKNHYPGVPFPEQYDGRMNDLKGQKVSYTPPTTGSGGLAMINPSQMTAMRLASFLQNAGNTAINALVPPAAAAPMPMATAAMRGPVNLNRLREAIVGKESGGSFTVINPDSGAIGIGQVMPENVGPWTAKHFGRRLTPDQFRNNRQAQIAVVNGQLNEILQQQLRAGHDTATAIRRTASIWYSGQGNLYNDSKPQYSNGQRYPSIREYTLDILRRYTRS